MSVDSRKGHILQISFRNQILDVMLGRSLPLGSALASALLSGGGSPKEGATKGERGERGKKRQNARLQLERHLRKELEKRDSEEARQACGGPTARASATARPSQHMAGAVTRIEEMSMKQLSTSNDQMYILRVLVCLRICFGAF